MKKLPKHNTQPNRPRPHYRVLYVEDEDDNWFVTEKHLRRHCRIDRARNDVEALKLLRNERYDFVLMDIQLSGSTLNGIDLTRRVRSSASPPDGKGTRSDVPVIFVTAYSAKYSREDLVAAGGDDLVTKPVDFVVLLRFITTLLRRSWKEDSP